ncbi:MAG: hypothetical protein Q9196_000711 [Gyalolechia fulgens]
MDAPPMPRLTPEQMQRASAYLPIEQVLIAAAFLTPDMLKSQIDNIDDNRGPGIIASAVIFLWAAAMALIKLSILTFYRRLFPQQNTTARWRLCHVTLCIASVALGIISIFGTAFQCTPVEYLWDRTIPGGRCINFAVFARFTNVANMLTDILILAMPIPIVWNLHLDRHKKIGVCGLFSLGGFVCIASIMRFYYLENYGEGRDVTCQFLFSVPPITLLDKKSLAIFVSTTNRTRNGLGDFIDSGIWSTVEPCIGAVSACLPIIGTYLRTRMIPFSSSVFRSGKQSGGAGPGYSWRTGGSAAMGNNGSADRRSFGRIGGESRGGHLQGSQDEEMGIPLKAATGLQVDEIRTSDS